jgi:hypothetical protein
MRLWSLSSVIPKFGLLSRVTKLLSLDALWWDLPLILGLSSHLYDWVSYLKSVNFLIDLIDDCVESTGFMFGEKIYEFVVESTLLSLNS